LPTFDDRFPRVLCLGAGGLAAPDTRLPTNIVNRQQDALPLRKSRIRISEWRQDGIITMHHFGLTRTTRVVWPPRRRRDHRA